MMKSRIAVLCMTVGICAGTAYAQSPVRIEYFFDNDPGYGAATVVDNVSTGDNTFQCSTDMLSEGAHILYVRSQDDRGAWSATVSRPLFIIKVRPTGGKVLEYFLDEDPGYGDASQMSVTTGASTLSLDLSDAGIGAHILYLRAQDDKGNWSTVVSHPLYVCSPRGIIALEYFFDDNDPGEGNGVDVPLPQQSGSTDYIFSFDIPTDGLAVGEHQFNLRAKGEGGVWTEVSSEPFEIMKSASGITDVKRTFPLTIKAGQSLCTLEGGDDRGDSSVEIYDISGTLLAASEWQSGVNNLSVSVNVMSGNVLMVKVVDLQNKRKVVRRVVCE